MLYAFTYDQFVAVILVTLLVIVAVAAYFLIGRDGKRHEKLYGFRKTVIRRKRPW